ncbi:uncharacterized protein LOC134815942 [Bolinopsis microptera]|uniref:uncharacterized protein LOC134815942 n=1 Tax=Bolinopsis microptera TaxID=2820187 RepID=UPI003079256E
MFKISLLCLTLLVCYSDAVCVWGQWKCHSPEKCDGKYDKGLFACSYGCHKGYCASQCMGWCASTDIHPRGCCTTCKEWCYLAADSDSGIGADYKTCTENSDCDDIAGNSCSSACTL